MIASNEDGPGLYDQLRTETAKRRFTAQRSCESGSKIGSERW
jgi:hypothetical protein